jgi:microcystin-dependent protein
MGQPYVGEIILVGFNFAPAGWAFCNGQLMPISENETLFQLIGTTYGGDGLSTFGLPDLRGRIPIGAGQGSGLQNYFLGETSGSETATLTAQQLAGHNHAVDTSALTATVKCKSGPALANQRTPVANVHALEAAGATMPFSSAAPDATMNADPVTISGNTAVAGGNQPHDNLQPFLGLNFCIALFGIFPPQS